MAIPSKSKDVVGDADREGEGKFEGRVPICLSQQFFLFGNKKAEDRCFVFVDHRKLLMTSAKRQNSSNSLEIAARQKPLLVSSRYVSAIGGLSWEGRVFTLPTFLICSTEKTDITARTHVLRVKDRNHKQDTWPTDDVTGPPPCIALDYYL